MTAALNHTPALNHIQVHARAGIRWDGATDTCISNGMMDRILPVEIMRPKYCPS